MGGDLVASMSVKTTANATFPAIDHDQPNVYNITHPGGAFVIDEAPGKVGRCSDFRSPKQP